MTQILICQKKFNTLLFPNSIQLYSNLYLEVEEEDIEELTILISTVKENCRWLLENLIVGNLYMHGDSLRK